MADESRLAKAAVPSAGRAMSIDELSEPVSESETSDGTRCGAGGCAGGGGFRGCRLRYRCGAMNGAWPNRVANL